MSEVKHPKHPILLVDDEINLLNSFELTLLDNGIDNTILCNDSRNVLDILKRTIKYLLYCLISQCLLLEVKNY